MAARSTVAAVPRGAAAVVTAAVFLVTLAVNLQMPLYRAYAQAAGYGAGLTAVVFACYVAGLLPTLIFLGGISDRLGRKPVVLAGMAGAAAATLLVIAWPRVEVLLVARILQGLAVGVTVGSATAYLAELLGDDPLRASKRVAVATALGFGGGALLTTIALLAGPARAPWSYLVALAAIVACAAVLAAVVPALAPLGGGLVRLPYFPRGSTSAGLAIAVAWAVSGLVVGVIPGQLAAHGLAAWAGPVLFLVNGAGVLAQPAARRMPPRRAILVGLPLIPAGYFLVIGGAELHALALVLAGACVAGAGCYGFAYLGGLARVAELAGEQRARGVAGYFLFAYVGFGAPSVLIGFGADAIGLSAALALFGALALALTLVLALRRGPGSLRGEGPLPPP